MTMRCTYAKYLPVKRNEGAYHHKPWSLSEEKELIRLVGEGYRRVQIAILMGRSVASINNKLFMMSLKGAKP